MVKEILWVGGANLFHERLKKQLCIDPGKPIFLFRWTHRLLKIFSNSTARDEVLELKEKFEKILLFF